MTAVPTDVIDAPPGPHADDPHVARRRLSPLVLTAAVAAFVATAFLVGNLWLAHRVHNYTSDDVGLQVALHSWRPWNGHVIRLGQDTFFLKLPVYVVAAIGWSPDRAVLFAESLVFNITGLLLLGWSIRFAVRRFAGLRDARADVLAAGALLVWFASVGGGLTELLLLPNVRNVELGMGLFLFTRAVVLYDAWDALPPRRRIVLTVVLCVAWGLAAFDDPYVLYSIAPPIVAVFGWRYLRSPGGVRDVDRDIVPLVVVFGSAAAWRVFAALGHVIGINAVAVKFNVIALDKVWLGFSTAMHDLLLYAGADIFGKDPTQHATLWAAAHLAVLVLGTVVGGAVLLRGARHQPWGAVLALLAPACFLEFALTDNVFVVGYERYVVYVIPECAVLVAVLVRSVNRRQAAAIALVVTASLWGHVGDTLKAFDHRPAAASNRAELAVVQALRERGLTRGYADYWTANVTTYLSRFTLDTVPVACDQDQRTTNRYDWFVDTTRFDRTFTGATFYVAAEPDNQRLCPLAAATAQFGAPIDQFTVSDRQVFVYDHDIGPALARP